MNFGEKRALLENPWWKCLVLLHWIKVTPISVCDGSICMKCTFQTIECVQFEIKVAIQMCCRVPFHVEQSNALQSSLLVFPFFLFYYMISLFSLFTFFMVCTRLIRFRNKRESTRSTSGIALASVGLMAAIAAEAAAAATISSDFRFWHFLVTLYFMLLKVQDVSVCELV